MTFGAPLGALGGVGHQGVDSRSVRPTVAPCPGYVRVIYVRAPPANSTTFEGGKY